MSALWNAAEVASATGGQASENFDLSGVSIDTRTIQPGDLFIALKGPNFDGHAYIEQALAAGAAGCLVSEPVDAPHILVEDTEQGLTDLGIAARDRYAGELLGITGSVGKTTTRALAVAAFGALGKTYGTKGNLNNHLGVPLTLANMPRDTEFAIIEMGMNHFGEIAHLSKMARPTSAIITAIDWVHSENLDGTLAGVAKAKGEIVEGLSGPLFAPAHLSDLLGFLDVTWVSEPFGGPMALPGEENRWNAALALAALPNQSQAARDAISALEPQGGRGKPLALTIKGKAVTVYDDAYNASPASMEAAVRNLVARDTKEGRGRKIAVVGDMAELANPLKLHENLGKFLADQPVDMVVAVGKFNASILAPLPPSILAVGFDSPMDVAPYLLPRLMDGDHIMVKASNSTGLSAVVAALAAADT